MLISKLLHGRMSEEKEIVIARRTILGIEFELIRTASIMLILL